MSVSAHSGRLVPVVLLACVLGPDEARAVPFTPGAVPDSDTSCFDRPPASPGLVPNVCVDLVENERYLRLLVYGFEVAPGQRLVFDWQADFWQGTIRLGEEPGGAPSERLLRLSGDVQHLWPGPGPVWEFETGLAAEPGDPDPPPALIGTPPLPHPDAADRYLGDFRMSPDIVLNGADAPDNEVGFLLDLEGFHGTAVPTDGDGDGAVLGPARVPGPAPLAALATALALLMPLAGRRRGG